MIAISTAIALILLGLAILAAAVRIALGPTLADRVLGLDLLTVLGIAVIGVFAVRTGLYLYVDIAVALALVSFLATIAFARYLISRDPE
jgi:multicomponent Na+:H+ antiporter subunit F